MELLSKSSSEVKVSTVGNGSVFSEQEAPLAEVLTHIECVSFLGFSTAFSFQIVQLNFAFSISVIS